MTNTPFSIPVRIYWEDTDAGGVVYHSRYINFAERARSEWVRSCGIDSQWEYAEKTGVLFVVKGLSVDYKSPAILDDVLEVTCEIFKAKKASVTFKQEILRSGSVMAEIFVTVACVNKQGRPVRLPTEIKDN